MSVLEALGDVDYGKVRQFKPAQLAFRHNIKCLFFTYLCIYLYATFSTNLVLQTVQTASFSLRWHRERGRLHETTRIHATPSLRCHTSIQFAAGNNGFSRQERTKARTSLTTDRRNSSTTGQNVRQRHSSD